MAIATAALVLSAVAAASSATFAGISYSEQRKLRQRAQKMEEERKAELLQEAEGRADRAKRAQTAGSRTGTRSQFLTGFGLGSAGADRPVSRGNLFGN